MDTTKRCTGTRLQGTSFPNGARTAQDNHLARSELVHRSSSTEVMFSLLLPIIYSVRYGTSQYITGLIAFIIAR